MCGVRMSNEYNVYKRIISRWDVWAQQGTKSDDKGRYGYFTKKTPLTENDIYDSILGEKKTIGAYIVNPLNNTCTNPQIDVDNHNGDTQVRDDVVKIFNELKRIGLNPYIEASSGELDRGAHIGLICNPTSAKICKTVLDNVLKTLDLAGHEVFPKQTEVNPDSFGNLVKLPFQFNNRTKARSKIINPETMQPFEKQDAINYLMALPDSVFGVETTTDITTEPIKKGVYFYDVFELENIKPCIVKAYDERLILHGKGDAGHEFRLAIAGNLLYNGATDQQVHEYFRQQSDYSAKATEKQIKSIKEYLAENKKPVGCKTLMENCNELLNGMCETCPKKPKERRGREKRYKQITSGNTEPELNEALGVYRGAMELAEEMEKITAIYYDVSKNFWMWKKDLLYYKRIDEIDILSSIRKMIPDSVVDSTFKTELITALKITGRERDVRPIEKHWMRFNDKVYDLKTKQFFKPEPTHFYTYPIPHNVGGSDSTPFFDKLFKDWMGDDAISLYEICAYCLLDDYPVHRMFILFGSGRNGKSQFQEILKRLVGMYNSTSTDIETLLNSRFEASKLYGRKIALIGETNFNEIKNTDKLKRLTGQDMMQGEYKHKDPFDYYNTAKIIIATNSIPETLDKTDGFMSRAIIKEFKNRFDEGVSVVETIPESEYENLIKKCIPILERLVKVGKFTNEGTIEEKSRKYERLSNPWENFVNLELQDNVNAKTPMWVIYSLYSDHCKKHGFRIPTKTDVTRKLKVEYEVKMHRFGERTHVTAFGIEPKITYVYEEHYDENVKDVKDVKAVQDNILHEEKKWESRKQVKQVKHFEESVTELTKLIIEAGEQFTKSNGVINSINLNSFSFWFCEQYHPKWSSNGESGEYTPTAIKGICQKVFALTPELNKS